jgi:hypothetical protein
MRAGRVTAAVDERIEHQRQELVGAGRTGPTRLRVGGSDKDADRFLAHYDDPTTCSYTSLYFTRGRVATPADRYRRAHLAGK